MGALGIAIFGPRWLSHDAPVATGDMSAARAVVPPPAAADERELAGGVSASAVDADDASGQGLSDVTDER